MNEHELAKQIKQYRDLQSGNKEIDVASLAMAAMTGFEADSLTSKEKRWAYFVSFGVPPFGLLYAIKFYTSGKSDGKTAAYVCLALTAASIISFFVISSVVFSSSGLNVDQIKQAPADYKSLLE